MTTPAQDPRRLGIYLIHRREVEGCPAAFNAGMHIGFGHDRQLDEDKTRVSLGDEMNRRAIGVTLRVWI